MKTIKKVIYYIIAGLLMLIESPMILFSCIALIIDFITNYLLDASIKLQNKIIIFNRKVKDKLAKSGITN
jgi:hypothetical protein